MAQANFTELFKLIKQVDAFKIPIKVTINLFQSDRVKGLYNEKKVKETAVHSQDEVVDEIRSYLLDRIENLDIKEIQYGYIGAFKAKGIRFMITNVPWGDVKPYGKNQVVTVQVIIEKA